MTKFLKNSGMYTINSMEGLELLDTLPIGTYALSYDKDKDFYFFSPIEGYSVGKVYGDATKYANRIMNTFKDRPSGTGVLLSGDKGSGKTMLAKILSIDGLKEDVITLVINEPLCGEDFNKVIQAIKQPAIVIFDEYEKVYNDHELQESLLTLLDGLYPSKKLFVLTTNDKYAINEHMLNRPGRLFYNIEYGSIEESFITEYCQDNLKNMSHLPSLLKIYQVFAKFNFDMLKAIVEEMNRYNEDATEAVAIMNIKPDDQTTDYFISMSKNGIPVRLDEEIMHIDPLEHFRLRYYTSKEKEKQGNTDHLDIKSTDILSIKGTTYTFHKNGYDIILKEDKSQKVFSLAERAMAV